MSTFGEGKRRMTPDEVREHVLGRLDTAQSGAGKPPNEGARKILGAILDKTLGRTARRPCFRGCA